MTDRKISVLWLLIRVTGFSPFASILSLGKCGEEMLRGWKIQQPRPLPSFQSRLITRSSSFETALVLNPGRDYCKSELLLAWFHPRISFLTLLFRLNITSQCCLPAMLSERTAESKWGKNRLLITLHEIHSTQEKDNENRCLWRLMRVACEAFIASW